MKKIICTLLLTATFACTPKEGVEIIVGNPLAIERNDEIVEIPLESISSFTQEHGDKFIITDKNGMEIAYQITHDGNIIFQASVSANGKSTYTIKQGTPKPYEILACGKQYPERLDDIAWENDRIAFRTYGPALQATGEKAFGYDIWVKKVPYPVVESRYNKELDPKTVEEIKELRKTNSEAAQELYNSVSYHVDHGDGLDYYSVGPTLGAGTSALLDNGSIVYPYCYKMQEILDNGPLRFTVKLIYKPLTVKGEWVFETRLLSLDAGSQLNKVSVTYHQLNEKTPVVTGIVMHEPSNLYKVDAEKGYMAYADPANEVNGQTFLGAVFTEAKKVKDIKPVYFSEEEKKERKANGHLLAESDYEPGSTYTYYFGGGWSKWGFQSPEEWFKYMDSFTDKVNAPLTVIIK